MNNVEAPQDNLEQIQAQVKERIEDLNQIPIIQEAYQRWQDHIPDWAKYHTLEHPDDVLQEALFFAIADGITDKRSLELIGIMVTFHDLAMTTEPDDLENLRKGHEKKGAQLAAEAMRRSGEYTEEEIKIVTESIEDTEIIMKDGVLVQQTARHDLGKYLLDGDVANFGRSDFSQKSELEFEELGFVLKNPPDRPHFNKNTFGLISHHVWQSESANKYRLDQQNENIENMGYLPKAA